ncbi:MAG: phosphocholine cytidylyltransferase family protein [Rhodospirillales bacterium]|nr:phosphocholine cytidylyltransferase family protein [Rhodospirillales bacterium]MBO6788810.1 phosphocholine cytidylyltransferase family protein [Rhodospirillales bacterium]
MHAIILAAGVGSRLFGDSRTQPPKSLIEFEGKTLLARHIENLLALGVEKLTLVVGYRKEQVAGEAERCAPDGFLEIIENPMYRGGSIISMWYARETYRRGESVLFMDADTLYDTEILKRLVDSSNDSAFVYDDDLDEGDDPVRICLRDGMVVDFGKRIVGQFDAMGEWPGFMKVSPETGPLLAASLENHIEGGQLMSTYEEAIRDVLVGGPTGVFGIVDASDLNWIEIDFPEDLERAREVILPKLNG